MSGNHIKNRCNLFISHQIYLAQLFIQNTLLIFINRNYNLYDKDENEALKGVIGYVPQDDLLIEDLTVNQNLYFNARMCLSNFSHERLIECVNQALTDLDLFEIKDLLVGNPLKKIISGGQRKRVNIALELLREPVILCIDEHGKATHIRKISPEEWAESFREGSHDVKREISRYNPGYTKPGSKLGRAHFYAPVKRIGKLEINTFWFNVMVIWIESIMLYIILYYKLIRRILDYLGNMRFQVKET